MRGGMGVLLGSLSKTKPNQTANQTLASDYFWSLLSASDPRERERGSVLGMKNMLDLLYLF